jgi:hypothetical protein
VADEKRPTPFLSTISISDYKPDPEAVNQALWGRDGPPSADDLEEMRKETSKELRRLRTGRVKED